MNDFKSVMFFLWLAAILVPYGALLWMTFIKKAKPAKGTGIFSRLRRGASDLLLSFGKDLKIERPKEKSETRKKVVVLATITSDGRDAKTLVRNLEAKGCCVSNGAKDAMVKRGFTTTKGVTYNLVGIPGEAIKDRDRTTQGVFEAGRSYGYCISLAEAAPLLCEKLLTQDLGGREVVNCHKPILDSYGRPNLLVITRHNGTKRLEARTAHEATWWSRKTLFVFPSSQECDSGR